MPPDPRSNVVVTALRLGGRPELTFNIGPGEGGQQNKNKSIHAPRYRHGVHWQKALSALLSFSSDILAPRNVVTSRLVMLQRQGFPWAVHLTLGPLYT
jgi:hypothetical protein